MATPREQHQARHGRVTGTDWERRRELELARSRAPGPEDSVLVDADEPGGAAPGIDPGEPAPAGVRTVTSPPATPPIL